MWVCVACVCVFVNFFVCSCTSVFVWSSFRRRHCILKSEDTLILDLSLNFALIFVVLAIIHTCSNSFLMTSWKLIDIAKKRWARASIASTQIIVQPQCLLFWIRTVTNTITQVWLLAWPIGIIFQFICICVDFVCVCLIENVLLQLWCTIPSLSVVTTLWSHNTVIAYQHWIISVCKVTNY